MQRKIYKPEIDGLRGLAIIAVIINHINKSLLPNGYLGVDIFFVISGYLITISLINIKSCEFIPFFIGFFSRRIKRLIPLLIVFVVITSIMIIILNPTPGYYLWAGIYSLLGLSNFEFWKNTVDYFAPTTSLNPFTHTWSLSIEAQFYFIFPFLIYYLGYKDGKIKKIKAILISLLTITIFSFVVFTYLYSTNESAAYFLMPSRAWELTTGSIVFLTHNKISSFFENSKLRFSNLIPILIIGTFLLPNKFPVLSTLIIVILTAIFMSIVREKDFIYKLFSNGILRYIGLISYSLYLWHWGILALSRQSVGIFWWTIPFQIVLIFLLSYFSYKYIERPFIEKNWSIKKIIISTSIALSSTILMLLAIGSNRKFIYAGKFPFESFEPIGNANNYQTDDNLNSYRKNTDGNAIYIFGDSHAYNLFPSLKKISKKYNFNKIFYLNPQKKPWDFEQLTQISDTDLLIYSGRAYWFKLSYVRSNIEALLKIAKTNNTKLILVDDLVPFGKNYHADFFPKFTFFRNGPSISRSEAEKTRMQYTDVLKKYVDNKTTYYIDPLTKVCDHNYCKAVVDGKLIYADGSPHFNKEGALILHSLWLEELPKILN